MSGGLIRGNTASSTNSTCNYAGGVCSSNGTIQKTGGLIYGVNPGRDGYNAADDNTAGGSGANKGNAVLWQDSSNVWHSYDGDITGNLNLLP
jgi:hypothetical protein